MARYGSLCTHYDGGGGNYVRVPESEFLETRTTVWADGKPHAEALVSSGGDGGGQNYEWVPIYED